MSVQHFSGRTNAAVRLYPDFCITEMFSPVVSSLLPASAQNLSVSAVRSSLNHEKQLTAMLVVLFEKTAPEPCTFQKADYALTSVYSPILSSS